MKYLLILDDNGNYGKNSEKYSLLECNEVVGPRAKDFKEFKNLEEATTFWQLTDVIV